MPEKPIKAIDNKPAVIRVIGMPSKLFGTCLDSLSLKPAKMVIASVKPIALAMEYITDCISESSF